MSVTRTVNLAVVIALAMMGTAVADDINQRPRFIVGDILGVSYDGVTDDLLTGGLGKTGLQVLVPPPFADPLAPTAAELRTRAIYVNYRALADNTLGEGGIAGQEYLAFAGPKSGRVNVTLMVQIPASFDPERPCIVTAA